MLNINIWYDENKGCIKIYKAQFNQRKQEELSYNNYNINIYLIINNNNNY